MKLLALVVIGGLAIGSGYLAYTGSGITMYGSCLAFSVMFIACCFTRFKC